MGKQTAKAASRQLVQESRPWNSRPPSPMKGLYAIKKDRTVIYVGRSDDIGRRLDEHFSGSSQAIDRSLGKKSNRYRQEHIQVSWFEDNQNKCHEQSVIEAIERRQKKPLKYNKRSGNSC